MEFWQKAKTFAEEAAKKTQTLTSPAKIADIVSETAKRSKEFAAEASKKADEIRAVADQSIKSLADQIPSSLSLLNSPSPPPHSEKHSLSELQTFGITDDLREFVQGLTSSTFLNFPVQGTVIYLFLRQCFWYRVVIVGDLIYLYELELRFCCFHFRHNL